MKKIVRVIRPNDRLQRSILAATQDIFRELRLHRGHIYTGFRQEFRGLYHGTAFGVAWNFIIPIVPLLVYGLLSSHRVIPNFQDVNAASYVTLGATIWFLLAGCVQVPILIVRTRNVEVMKTALPLSAAVVTGFTQLMFDTFVRLIFVALVILVTATNIHWSAAAIPFILLPSVLLFIGIGLMLSIANVIYADVGRITNIIVQYGIFLSGVIFPIAILPFSDVLSRNPAYIFIENMRNLLFHGQLDDPWLLISYAALGFIVFMTGCRIFYIMEYRVRGIV